MSLFKTMSAFGVASATLLSIGGAVAADLNLYSDKTPWDAGMTGIADAASNAQGQSPKRRAFTMSAELFLMQHTCHWYCKSKMVASARMLARHRTPYQQLVDSVSDDEIREGIRLLAQTTGIFTETAGGVTTAVLAKLARSGAIDPDERVVAYITGHGLKTLDAVSPTVGPTAVIPPTLDAFHEAFPPDELEQ